MESNWAKSHQSLVLESKGSFCETEQLLETLRLESAAMEKQFLHQLDAAKGSLETALKAKRKGDKRIIKLEAECRRLHTENEQLREEMKALKLKESNKNELSPQFSSASTCITEPDNLENSEQQADFNTISQQFTDLHSMCKEQSHQVVSCLSTLRSTRQDNALLLEAVCQVQELLLSVHPQMPHALAIEKSGSQGDDVRETEEGEYCRLLDEIQDMTERELIPEESLFQGAEPIGDSYIISQPQPFQTHFHPIAHLDFPAKRGVSTQTKPSRGSSALQRAYSHFLSHSLLSI